MLFLLPRRKPLFGQVLRKSERSFGEIGLIDLITVQRLDAGHQGGDSVAQFIFIVAILAG
jgi:hypothetical protein